MIYPLGVCVNSLIIYKFWYNKIMNKIWFKRKKYGWGWTPSTWEGWLVITIWIFVFILEFSKKDNSLPKNIIFILMMIGLLIYISYKKGETPRWQWGNKKDEIDN